MERTILLKYLKIVLDMDENNVMLVTLGACVILWIIQQIYFQIYLVKFLNTSSFFPCNKSIFCIVIYLQTAKYDFF